ncbi:hypothetical protein F4554_001303 [Actinopolymorpha rutila]|uniref:Uncharacterized protein n=1 Tax=Actinopolymorpha rutila TaxID=446787 RepID=A0A852Z8X2_9ACTN|nr:hypothetical protein [Actinopolymorpha rutila]
MVDDSTMEPKRAATARGAKTGGRRALTRRPPADQPSNQAIV